MTHAETLERIRDLQARVRELRQASDNPAIERTMQLLDLYCHMARWELGGRRGDDARGGRPMTDWGRWATRRSSPAPLSADRHHQSPGNEVAGARFLAEVLTREGIESETIEAGPGRASLRARLPGDGSLGGIVLHHHIDVVYADRRYWTVDPFGGVIADGYLYGRGAIDMKSTGILHLAALLAAQARGVPLKRDLVFLATADEEAGSEFGAQFIADRRPDWLAGAEYAISEIGLIQMHPGLTAPLASIVISEKTGLPITLTARGERRTRLDAVAGHRAQPARPRARPAARGGAAAARAPGSAGVLLPHGRGAARGASRRLRRPRPTAFAIRPSASASTRTGSTRRWSGRRFAVTMLRGSAKSNVIPPEATAQIDCRMLARRRPGGDRRVGAARGGRPERPGAVRPGPEDPELSPPDTELYKAMADTLRRRAPGAVVAPMILGRLHRQLGVPPRGLHGYGFSPVRHRGGRAPAHPRQRRAHLAREPARGRAGVHGAAAERGGA